jgi:hypothetical protein
MDVPGDEVVAVWSDPQGNAFALIAPRNPG